MNRSMSDVSPDFKISRAGKVIHENLTLAQVAQGVASKSIESSDHYWSNGMADWALISSRQWVVPFVAAPTPAPTQVPTPAPKPTPVATPAPGPTQAAGAAQPSSFTTPSQSRPAAAPTRTPPVASTPPPRQPAEPTLANPIEKGFSPYVTYYRSNDDRWAFGIFGGLAHRNVWPKPMLLLVRLLMLITFFPGLAYLGWGFTAMLLTPSLPTSNVKSYFDLNNGKPSQDATDLSRLIKILVVGFIVLVVVVWFVSRRF